MSEISKIIEGCYDCELCVEDCEFLKQVCKTPRDLAEKFKVGFFRENLRVTYSCNLCDLCERVCPEDLNIGKMCLEARQQLVKEGLAPLPAHKYVKRDQEWSLSRAFAFSLPDPNAEGCKRVFFPGCSLAGYSPHLVIKTYDYLRERLAGTGIILGCCGAPTRELGEELQFEEILGGVESAMSELGASEIIVACPNCYYNFKHYVPQLQMRCLYEVMAEIGLPETKKTREWTFSLHDSCKARWEEDLQQSVRTLVKRIGYRIKEMEYSRDMTRCCGVGGVISFVDFDLGKNITKRRIAEAPFDMLTYCGSCREAFAREKPSIHVLDLIFNTNWVEDRLKPPNKASIRRENQSLLKSQLEKRG